MPPRHHRLFVAFDLPDATRGILAGLTDLITLAEPLARAVPATNLHATVVFIGQATPHELEVLAPALFDAMRGPAVTTRITGLVARPNAGRARLLAAQYDDSSDLAAAAARRVGAAVTASIGRETGQGAFWPHITLARLRRPTRVRRFPTPESEHVFAFDRITLYDSYITSGAPPRYQPLMTVPLDSLGERKLHG